MSVALKDLANSTFAKLALAAAASFGAAANTNANVAYSYRKPEAVPALQQQVLTEEHMAPVAARFRCTQ